MLPSSLEDSSTQCFYFIEVEIPRAVEDQVHKIFLDPTGRHLVISMESTENYYLSRNSKKPKQIGKIKVLDYLLQIIYDDL